MDSEQALIRQESAHTIDEEVQTLFSKLDEALDDYEDGRVISEEEMWTEIDAV